MNKKNKFNLYIFLYLLISFFFKEKIFTMQQKNQYNPTLDYFLKLNIFSEEQKKF